MSALNMSVLDGIKGGGASMLKKAAPVEKKIDPRMNMLAALKGGGAGLKKVDKESIEKKKEEAAAAAKTSDSGGGAGGMVAGVNAILERRKFLEAESDSDSGSDDDWE